MTSTSPEHERIIDIFDEIITFSYAYEWQKLQNKEIDNLSKLRELICSHIEIESRNLFLTPKKKESAVMSILNKLNQAVEDDSCPEVIDLSDVWLNKPNILSGQYLVDKHNEEFDFITGLVTHVVLSLSRSLPDEMKPFVTIEQVDAMFKKSWAEWADKVTVPIHKELLVTIIHQYFLKTFPFEQTFEEVNAYRELVDRYCKKALQRFVEMVEEKVIDDSVIKFFTQAKDIDLEIGRYYSWALICYGPINYQELLSWYSSVNAHYLVKDVRYKRDKALDNVSLDAKLVKILHHEFGYSQCPSTPKVDFKRYMFDSNRTPIRIDGNTLQNHLVMVFPYDKPLPDLKDKLRGYGRYIGNMVNSYGRTYGHSLGYEDEVKSATAYRNKVAPYQRRSLSNVGSVLGHICSLVCLQYERSNDYSDKLKKSQKHDAFQLIKSHGFGYSIDSVEAARKSKEKKMHEIVTGFIKPS